MSELEAVFDQFRKASAVLKNSADRYANMAPQARVTDDADSGDDRVNRELQRLAGEFAHAVGAAQEIQVSRASRLDLAVTLYERTEAAVGDAFHTIEGMIGIGGGMLPVPKGSAR